MVFEKDGGSVGIEVGQDKQQDARSIVVAGIPLDQPVVQYGRSSRRVERRLCRRYSIFRLDRMGSRELRTGSARTRGQDGTQSLQEG